jgi:single-stranded DNA-specific DHH superfamily exonuclease
VSTTSISQYISKFFPSDYNEETSSKFFTQYGIDEYFEKLPILLEVENFSLRLLLALIKNEKVCIYADFDTDAVTSTAVLFHGLLDQGFKEENLFFYTPDRFKEGYGINLMAIKKLAQDFDLIVSVDCGINSVIEADFVLNNSNCDLIITDHHLLTGKRPKAIAVCNPQMENFLGKADYLNLVKMNFTVLISKLNEIDKQNKFDISLFENKVNRRFEDLKTKKDKLNFLSKSVTGVGVAWFCLLNFAYFLEEIGFD